MPSGFMIHLLDDRSHEFYPAWTPLRSTVTAVVPTANNCTLHSYFLGHYCISEFVHKNLVNGARELFLSNNSLAKAQAK
jgi:hypothetical protein